MPKPKPKSARTILCDCGKRFRRPQDQLQHTLESPLHQQAVVDGLDQTSLSTVIPDSSGVEEPQEPIPSSSTEIHPADGLYTIKAIAGKGKGVVAATEIPKGTRILSEPPLFKVPRNNPNIKALEGIIAKEVESLSEDQQHSFFDLANIYGNVHSRPLGIARTNVLPLGSNASSGGLFLEASRINHSCRHNSQNTWNQNIGQLTIHALRDIKKGEEITITYLGNTPEYAERQRFLRESFKFDCRCELCSMRRAEQKRSDTRLKELEAIDEFIGHLFWGGVEQETALNLLHKMFVLFGKEGIWNASIARAYNDAYEIAAGNGDNQRARIFAERAYDARRIIEGDDSPVTMKMKRIAEALPAAEIHGLSEVEFENWLWMLE